jgi:DNA modification methylase
MTNPTTPPPTPPATDTVPLALWPVAQTTARYQRAGRYHPDCAHHPGKMLPELARRIVAEYSEPGALVADPMAGTATTLIEAATLGRRAVGIELEGRWVDLAHTNINHALPPDAAALVEIRRGDATALDQVAGDLAGTVDLVCTSPPYGCDVSIPNVARWRAEGRLGPSLERNYSTDTANLGHARGHTYTAAMAKVYAGCFTLLRPGGILAVVTKNSVRRGRTLDLAGLTVALAEAAGFTYLQHVIALHAAIRDGDLVDRASLWQRQRVRNARNRGEPAHLVSHEDVSILRRPEVPSHA